MKSYLIVVIGCVVFTAIVSFFAPKGKFEKQVLYTVRMACLAVLLAPVINGISAFTKTSYTFYREEEAVVLLEHSQNKQLSQILFGIFGVDCDVNVSVKVEEGKYEVQEVEVFVPQNSEELISQIQAYLQELGYIYSNVHA